MANVIIFTPSPGAPVAICRPVEASVIECLERVKNDHPEGRDFQVVEDTALPEDRYFRDAWVLRKGHIDYDLSRAKEVHIQHRISCHKSELKKMIEDENVLSHELDAKKQIIRDLPIALRAKLSKLHSLVDIKKCLED